MNYIAWLFLFLANNWGWFLALAIVSIILRLILAGVNVQ